jgi:hypothetical protein
MVMAEMPLPKTENVMNDKQKIWEKLENCIPLIWFIALFVAILTQIFGK